MAFYKNTGFKITAIILVLFFSFQIIVFSSGCSRLEIEIFGLKFPKEEISNGGDEDYPEAIIYDEKEVAVTYEKEDYEKSLKAESDTFDISMQRKYFLEGIKYFEDKSYLLAEYYFNKLKDDYSILQDHTLYYLSKSLFMQEKYDSAEEHYKRLIEDYPHSIWQEKSYLEYADLFFLKEDYIKAEEEYTSFLIKFTSSLYYPYALFQLAVCQEKNEKYPEAYNNYKKIWAEYPENYYSGPAFDSLGRLSEEKGMEKFIPTARQIYSRGEIFFKKYLYTDAIEEFGKILEEEYLDGLPPDLHSRTLFRIGMCYYNLRNYEKAKDYLIMGYEKFPSSNVSDDSLYFIGRAFTNLGSTDEALLYYQKLLDKFPQSKYADDSLYRMGRIYYFM